MCHHLGNFDEPTLVLVFVEQLKQVRNYHLNLINVSWKDKEFLV